MNNLSIRIYVTAMILVLSVITGCSKKSDDSNPSPAPVTVTDIDGNVYQTIKIGTQVWMVENLKTTRLNDGSAIPLVTGSSQWSVLTTPGFCWYDNNVANKNVYGALYNWFAVSTGKLAPVGWHVATDAEWTVLTTFLGGETVAGGKMKSVGKIEDGTGLWYSPNTNATNGSGFSAVPAGLRKNTGEFQRIGILCCIWSSSVSFEIYSWYRLLRNDVGNIYPYNNHKGAAMSVRCIRD